MAELSLVSVVLFISSGGLVFILLFLFAKRQITRFTLKSARRPHVNIGTDAPKIMRQEIKRRMDRVEHLMYEPMLLTERVQLVASSVPNHYYYRMKALDAYTNAIESLRENEPTMEVRHPTQTIRQYLFSLCPSAITGPAHKSDIIHRFSDGYVQARHDPAVSSKLGRSVPDTLLVLQGELCCMLQVFEGDSFVRHSCMLQVFEGDSFVRHCVVCYRCLKGTVLYVTVLYVTGV
ncbi:protein C1orf43 homolog isoform X2 [Haliotis cracherodii]|uniref:protein C1orf43 homolog isoform X2 n=1 Tax=Haliotis cracherodii TaxID=6455 RepID=UPI0039ED16AF